MEPLLLNDFSAGWCPSDDAVNGRKNALLQMDSLELDQNGAVVMTRGTKNWRSHNYATDAHSLYSKFLAGTRYQYLALISSGDIYRNATSIITGGSVIRAGFFSAFDYVFIYSGSKRARDDGSTTTNIGITANSAPAASLNGAGVLYGDYEYAEMAVYNSGSAYFAKSALSAITGVTGASANKISVTAHTPTSPANETWIYRRGGSLDQWYRVKVLTSSFTSAFDDNMSDLDAANLNQTANIYLTPTNSTGISEDILDVVGLINGRSIMFTKKNIYFSEINSPDSYDTRTTIGITASNSQTGSELFLWAKKVGNNQILVGTTIDVYILGGTYIQQPDGTLDVYFRGLGCHNPPLSIDACVYNSQVIYNAKCGWVMCNTSGDTFPLCPPNTDTLYRGNTVYGYGGVPAVIYSSSTIRYFCCVAKNKLWTCVPVIVGNNPATAYTYRFEIYDFIRKYWRPMPLIVTALMSEEDDAITGFFSAGGTRNIRLIDNPVFSSDDKTFNGPAGTKQTITFKTTFNDLGVPRNRKESYTFKLKVNTNNENLTVKLYKDESTSPSVNTTIASNGINEKFIAIDTTIGTFKTLQVELSGQLGDFLLEDISIHCDLRPEQLTFKAQLGENFGIAGRKRITNFPIVIDTLSQDVTFTPSVDGIAKTPITINTSYKATFNYPYTSDLVGVDFKWTLSGAALFEYYENMASKFIEPFPDKLKFYTIPVTDFGIASKKRVRTWPIIIDTFSQDVTFTPIIDGVAGVPLIINTSQKSTVLYFFKTDIFGVDYSGTFSGATAFELWKVENPEIVQILPVAKQFDQIGPTEFFRYSRIREIEFKIQAFGGTLIPYAFYAEDTLIAGAAGNITVIDTKETIARIRLPKTTADSILRIELGPTAFNFHRLATKILVVKTGDDAEGKWVELEKVDVT